MQNKKILIIEDNIEISQSIKDYLELEDFEVTTKSDGESGLDAALTGKYDLILLDLMLPLIDGYTIARKLQTKGDTPIIMMTAKDAIDDKLKGFDVGALDYIVKPFDLRELEVRVRLVLNKNIGRKTLEIDGIEIDIHNRIFKKDGDVISLTQKEFLIMELLIARGGQPVSRTDIIEYVWGGGDAIFDSDAKLDVYMSTIRNKLSKGVVKTIKGFGYQIIV